MKNSAKRITFVDLDKIQAPPNELVLKGFSFFWENVMKGIMIRKRPLNSRWIPDINQLLWYYEVTPWPAENTERHRKHNDGLMNRIDIRLPYRSFRLKLFYFVLFFWDLN